MKSLTDICSCARYICASIDFLRQHFGMFCGHSKLFISVSFFCISIDGNFTEWSEWSSCSVTCGNGTQMRHRNCTNPVPAFGGKTCTGEYNETRHCSPANCPVGECQFSHFRKVSIVFATWQNLTEFCLCESESHHVSFVLSKSFVSMFKV